MDPKYSLRSFQSLILTSELSVRANLSTQCRSFLHSRECEALDVAWRLSGAAPFRCNPSGLGFRVFFFLMRPDGLQLGPRPPIFSLLPEFLISLRRFLEALESLKRIES